MNGMLPTPVVCDALFHHNGNHSVNFFKHLNLLVVVELEVESFLTVIILAEVEEDILLHLL